eukprot:CAMPEP_0179490198 /NCGR_PEP_ID=MMETSP0799-20121207/65312_1 /TAXON_ID=46947 /ORGANISM="Geminigera cryophila, Strain CCMP2564" /LENGTH=85 /DNA_ID=CAMNT_0021306337 /DNA_START=23 /DNA_END=280 /DNA_ORIENTATION=-
MAEMVVIGAIVVLPIWILADAGSIKAPCQPEHRKERKPMQSVKAPEAMDKTWKSWVQETAHDRSRVPMVSQVYVDSELKEDRTTQ